MSIPSDELNEQRLSRELRLAARAFDLTPGSELAVVTEGRRRRHRRRQMTAVAMVAAVGGGTAVAISQLAGTGDSSISTDEPQSTESPDSDTAPSVSVLTDPSIPPSSVQASVPDAHVQWVRYEALATDPQGTLARLWAFLGLECPADVLALPEGPLHMAEGNPMRLRPLDRVSLDRRWEAGLDAGCRAYFERHAGALNRSLGYGGD